MKKIVISLFFLSIVAILPVSAQSESVYLSNPLKPFETANSFYHISKVPIDLIAEDGSIVVKEVRISYRSEELVRISRNKNVKFRIEVPDWDRPFILEKVWKQQVIIGGIDLHNIIVNQGKLTLSENQHPVLEGKYFYQSYASFEPFKVIIKREFCEYKWDERICRQQDILAAIHERDRNYKSTTGVQLIWEFGFTIPLWNATITDSTNLNEVQTYSQTVTDRFCVHRETNKFFECGEGISLDDVTATVSATDTAESPIPFEFIFLGLGVLTIFAIYRRKRQ